MALASLHWYTCRTLVSAIRSTRSHLSQILRYTAYPCSSWWAGAGLRCIRATARLLADRIGDYRWFDKAPADYALTVMRAKEAELAAEREKMIAEARSAGTEIKAEDLPKVTATPVEMPIAYTTKEATFKRRGDVVHMLPESEKITYRPMELAAEQVVCPDGELYTDDKASPILFLGDSYAGVYHYEDCKNAGITAHIAKELGMPLDLVIGQGMGPEVRKKAARRGVDAFAGKRLVIWSLSERDLFNYKSPWDIIPMP